MNGKSGRAAASRSFPMMARRNKELLTKREIEENPHLNSTCPPLLKKHESPMTSNKLISSSKKARLLSSNRGALNNTYDPDKNESYFSQMYQIQCTIGEGSFGIVYKVICRNDNHQYAVKVSKKSYSSESKIRNEIRILEMVGNHPNIVKYYLAWEENSRIFVQLELCALSLGIYSKRSHSISTDQLWDILVDMLKALSHLHKLELIHLDVKPDNILMSVDSTYKLGDFGQLQDLNHIYDSSEGDAKYLAAEVLKGTFTTSADIFSLGITMFELATDFVLPIHGSLWRRLREVNEKDTCFNTVPEGLKNLICKMMNSDWRKRPTASNLLESSLIKKALVQSMSNRINYYEKWIQMNEDDDCQPVAVYINNNNNNNHHSPIGAQPNQEPILGRLPTGMVNDTDDSARCVTPPRKVSRVIIYNTC